MDLLVDFSLTGQIGPLHCGMSLAEAESLLGPGRPHPAIRLKGPDLDGYPYSWRNLDLVITQRMVSGLWIRLRPGTTAKLPPLALPDSEMHSATVLREEFLDALEAVRCPFAMNPQLTFGEQSSVITQPGGVCAVFTLPARDDEVPHRDRHYLTVLHKHTA
jgi:hypothetical protein